MTANSDKQSSTRGPNTISRVEYMNYDIAVMKSNPLKYRKTLHTANTNGFEFVTECTHQLHQVSHYTVQELGELLDYSDRIRYQLKKLNIFIIHEFNYQTQMYQKALEYQAKHNIKPIIDDPGDFIAALYQLKQLSLRQIAEIMDCTYPTISKTLKKRNIKLRPRGGAQTQKLSSKQIELIIFNHNLPNTDPDKMQPKHLCKKLGVCKEQIYYWINKNKKHLKGRNKKMALNIKLKNNFVMKSDNSQMTLYSAGVTGEDSNNPGEEKLIFVGHYTSIPSFLKGYVYHSTLQAKNADQSDITTLQQLSAYVLELKKELSELFEFPAETKVKADIIGPNVRKPAGPIIKRKRRNN